MLPLTALAALKTGFTRAGRTKAHDIEVVLLNSPGATEIMAHLLEFDSTHGKFASPITFDEDWMDVGTGRISVTYERDPALLPHGALDVDVVLNVLAISTAARNLLPIYPRVRKKYWFLRLPPGQILPLFTGSITSYAQRPYDCFQCVLYYKLSGAHAKVMNDSFGLISAI